MRYLCTNCNYIYDEWMGEKGDEIASGVRCDDDFVCPGCDECGGFHEIEEEINVIDETNQDEYLELEHIPVIQILPPGGGKYPKGDGGIEWKILQVRVGRESHTMWPDHRISTISLYDEYGDLIEEEFLEEDNEAMAEFDVSDFDDIEIRVRCSLHGTWSRKISL